MEGLDDSSRAGMEIANESLRDLRIQAPTDKAGDNGSGVEITNFSELVEDVTLHFQIIRLQKQVHLPFNYAVFFVKIFFLFYC